MISKNEVAMKEKMEYLSKDNPIFLKLFKSISVENGIEFASLAEVLQELIHLISRILTSAGKKKQTKSSNVS